MEFMADACTQLRDALECLSQLCLRDKAAEGLEVRQGHHHLRLVVVIFVDLETESGISYLACFAPGNTGSLVHVWRNIG